MEGMGAAGLLPFQKMMIFTNLESVNSDKKRFDEHHCLFSVNKVRETQDSRGLSAFCEILACSILNSLIEKRSSEKG